MANSQDIRGFAKVKAAAQYAGVSDRTFEKWLRNGLECIQLPSGLRLVAYADIDSYLAQYRRGENQVDQIVDEVLREFK